jgi:hypothetical protein
MKTFIASCRPFTWNRSNHTTTSNTKVKDVQNYTSSLYFQNRCSTTQKSKFAFIIYSYGSISSNQSITIYSRKQQLNIRDVITSFSAAPQKPNSKLEFETGGGVKPHLKFDSKPSPVSLITQTTVNPGRGIEATIHVCRSNSCLK